jgi:hypothetical protein
MPRGSNNADELTFRLLRLRQVLDLRLKVLTQQKEGRHTGELSVRTHGVGKHHANT